MESADARLRREPDEPRRVPEPRQRPERGFRGGGSAALGGRVAGGGRGVAARRGEGRRGRSSDERLRSVSDGRRRCLRRRVRVADAVGGARVHGRLARVRGGRVRASRALRRGPDGREPMRDPTLSTRERERGVGRRNRIRSVRTGVRSRIERERVFFFGRRGSAASGSGGGGAASAATAAEWAAARSQTTGPRGGRRPAGAR